VRGNTGLLQTMQQEVRIEAIEGDVEALHVPMWQAARPFVKASG
jgi:hypothetical protein